MQANEGSSSRRDLAPLWTPTITIYLPRSLRKRLDREPESCLLYGWSYFASPSKEKTIIVVAGNISLQQAEKHCLRPRSSTRDTLGLVGACRPTEEARRPSCTMLDTIRERSVSWFEIYMTDMRSRRWRDTEDSPVIDQIRAPLKSSDTCAINVILYTIPQAERMKYYNLEKVVLPRASSAGTVDQHRLIGSEEQVEASAKLKEKLRFLINLDPLRFQELQYTFEAGLAPGEAFRSAINLVSRDAGCIISLSH